MATDLSILKPLGKSPSQHLYLCCRAQCDRKFGHAHNRRAELARDNHGAGRRTSQTIRQTRWLTVLATLVTHYGFLSHLGKRSSLYVRNADL